MNWNTIIGHSLKSPQVDLGLNDLCWDCDEWENNDSYSIVSIAFIEPYSDWEDHNGIEWVDDLEEENFNHSLNSDFYIAVSIEPKKVRSDFICDSVMMLIKDLSIWQCNIEVSRDIYTLVIFNESCMSIDKSSFPIEKWDLTVIQRSSLSFHSDKRIASSHSIK